MTKRLPAQYVQTRVIPYADPAPPHPGELLLQLTTQAVQKQQQDRVLYARWLVRHQEITERDRKVRRIALRVAAVVVPVSIGLGIWAAVQVWQAVAAFGVAGLFGAAVVGLALAAGLGVVGHRCVIVVQHWHR